MSVGAGSTSGERLLAASAAGEPGARTRGAGVAAGRGRGARAVGRRGSRAGEPRRPWPRRGGEVRCAALGGRVWRGDGGGRFRRDEHGEAASKHGLGRAVTKEEGRGAWGGAHIGRRGSGQRARRRSVTTCGVDGDARRGRRSAVSGDDRQRRSGRGRRVLGRVREKASRTAVEEGKVRRGGSGEVASGALPRSDWGRGERRGGGSGVGVSGSGCRVGVPCRCRGRGVGSGSGSATAWTPTRLGGVEEGGI